MTRHGCIMGIVRSTFANQQGVVTGDLEKERCEPPASTSNETALSPTVKQEEKPVTSHVSIPSELSPKGSAPDDGGDRIRSIFGRWRLAARFFADNKRKFESTSRYDRESMTKYREKMRHVMYGKSVGVDAREEEYWAGQSRGDRKLKVKKKKRIMFANRYEEGLIGSR